MKTDQLQNRQAYCAPMAQVALVAVERGYAATTDSPQWGTGTF